MKYYQTALSVDTIKIKQDNDLDYSVAKVTIKGSHITNNDQEPTNSGLNLLVNKIIRESKQMEAIEVKAFDANEYDPLQESNLGSPIKELKLSANHECKISGIKGVIKQVKLQIHPYRAQLEFWTTRHDEIRLMMGQTFAGVEIE